MNGIAKIIYDTYKGNIPTKFASVSKEERDEAIRKELFKALGIEEFEKKAFRRAWRENKNKAFAVIEESRFLIFPINHYLICDFFDYSKCFILIFSPCSSESLLFKFFNP